MTCIVGLIEGGIAYMSGDSAGVAGYSLQTRADEKVFRNGPCLMGFTSSFRMGQLLRYAFVVPDRDPRVDVNKYMVTTFIDAVRKCLKDGGYEKIHNNTEEGGIFLVAYDGKLFLIDSDFQVGCLNINYNSVGCGQDIALGSMYSTAKLPPKSRLNIALSAAESFSAGVRRPFKIISMKQV